MLVDLDIRHRQLVADAQIECQLRAFLPVVLDVRIKRMLTKATDPAGLQRCLLRKAEEEVGEIRPGCCWKPTAISR